MTKKAWGLLLIFVIFIGGSSAANAELITIGRVTYEGTDYNLIYEDDQELIWLDYSLPNQGWHEQMATVAQMNKIGVLTYKIDPGVKINWLGSWRLPLAVDGARKNGYDGTTTAGFNITSSEMGHLYYESLGNIGIYDTNGNLHPGWGKLTAEQEPWGLKNTGPFENLRKDSYWTGTEYSAYTQHAWDFNTYFGCLDVQSFKGSMHFPGIAVRTAAVSILK